MYRSTLSSIFVLAITKLSLLCEYTADAILEHFVDESNMLSQGYTFELATGKKTLYGAVICSVGDIPASNFIRGFKDGVGFSLGKCCMCLATGVEISLKFHATSFIKRNPELHNSYLELIEIGGSRHCVTYASQMLTLVRLFLLLCGDVEVENDKHWDCYLILLAICDMAFSFDVQENDPTKFGWMVQVYLESFVTLYTPQFSVTPKMNYLVHLTKQMTVWSTKTPLVYEV
uniref:Uncharacterized protein n=1 Tax=Amphimedon queenslandica TaxID=400682 RepID=A0A1X7UQ82_AMPQE